MSLVKGYKVVSSLPETLERDALYLVRVGDGFDLYATTKNGSPVLAKKVNAEEPLGNPSSNGQVLSSTTGGARSWVNMPSPGPFKNFVSIAKSDTSSITPGGSWTNIPGLELSIAPQSTGSNILVRMNIAGDLNQSGASAFFRITRNGSPVGIGNSAGNRIQAATGFDSYVSGDYAIKTASAEYMDSPGITSSLTYRIQVYAKPGITTLINRNAKDLDNDGYGRFISTISLTEIA